MAIGDDTGAKDLPAIDPASVAPGARRPLQRMTEELRRLLGFSGDPLDMAVTWRQLYQSGLVALSALQRVGGGRAPGSIVIPPGGGSGTDYEIDLTPPPNVTGLTAAAGFSRVVVQWDAPTYSQGNGPGQTILYAAFRTPGSPQPVFADATRIFDATHPLNIAVLSTELNTRVHVWAKYETVDGVLSVDPAGGINGVTVTTSPDVTQLLQVLTDEITESQLYAALRGRLDLIDGAGAGSVNARILDEANARAADLLAEAAARSAAIAVETSARTTADLSLAEQITLITAGAGEQFDYASIFYFDTGVDGWTGNGAPTAGSSLIHPAIDAVTYIESPTGLGVNGTSYTTVKLRLKKFGTPTWAPAHVRWKNAGGSYSANIDLDEPTWDANGFGVCTVQVAWSGTIDQVLLGFGLTTAGNYYGCDWFAIGRSSPGASTAALASEISARASGDAAEASARNTLASQMRGSYTGTDIGSVTTGLLYSERQARSTADTAIASDVSALSATVASNLATVNAAITSEATTRASQDAAISSTVTSLSATVGANYSTLSASISAESSARASVDGHMSAAYTLRVQLTEDGRAVSGGFGIMGSSGGTAGPTIDFGVIANKFWIGAPAGATGVSSILPFVVQTSTFTENGVTRPPGVYMDAAYIRNLTAVYATIQTLVADSIAAATIAVGKLAAGSITAGAYIQSPDYTPGLLGWRISGSGAAEFSNGVFRGTIFASGGVFSGTLSAATGVFSGTIYAGAGSIGGITISTADLRSTGYVPGTSGFRVNNDGSAEFYNLTARGNITANSLNAATGTLGSLTIASGGSIRLTASGYNTDGLFAGDDGGVAKFSLKNGAKSLLWDGTDLFLNNVSLDAFTSSIPGGNINLTGLSAGDASYGSRTVTVAGGKAPYTHFWIVSQSDVRYSSIGQVISSVYIQSGAASATATFRGRNNGATNTAAIACFTRDANGRMAMATISLSAGHLFDPGAGD